MQNQAISGKIDFKNKLPNGQGPSSGMISGQINIVPFNSGMDASCFVCKEKLRIDKDEPSNPLTTGDADENQYFMDAKKIRVTTKDKITG